jgi:hypothetical protein
MYCAGLDSALVGFAEPVCASSPAQTAAPTPTPRTTATSPLGTQANPSQFCDVCTVLTAPLGLSAQRDNTFGATVILMWNSVSSATFYRSMP